MTESILVVDDATENLLILEAILQNAGFDILTVDNGTDAIKTAIGTSPDLVLLDISMPEMDGFEVCRRFKANDDIADIPIIFISSYTEAAEKVKGLTLGGVDYITKPFDVEEVIARVGTHLELQKLRREVEESYTNLQALEDQRDNLVHMMVHDMRNHLSNQQFSLELLKGEPLSEQAKQDIADALTSNDHLVHMANDLLAVSRLESGRMPITRVDIDLAELVAEAVKAVSGLAESKGVSIAHEIEKIDVDCDPEITSRVLVNLLHNAIKFTPSDGQIKITAECTDNDINVSVIDPGPGIPKEHLNRIFDKFGQSRETRKYSASGLGLTFCKLAVEAHGGNIGVDSERGEGSRFWFCLPRGVGIETGT